jgi:Uma2 family endonuclease
MTIGEIKTAPPRGLPHRPISYEEYVEWADENIHAEWVDGEIVVHMPPFEIHQTLLSFVHRLLAEYVEFEHLGRVLIAPFEMRLLSQKSARQPDILVVTSENLRRLSQERLEGPADLVVELVSQDSVRRDRQEKFREYQEAGVREYWVIDSRPGRNRADFYRLDEHGQYALVGTEDDEWVGSIVLPGFRLRPSWLWLEDKPSVRLAFFESLSPEQRERYRQSLFGFDA